MIEITVLKNGVEWVNTFNEPNKAIRFAYAMKNNGFIIAGLWAYYNDEYDYIYSRIWKIMGV